MLLKVAAREYVFAGEYTDASRATLGIALAQFSAWAEREEQTTDLDDVTPVHIRHYIAWLKSSPTPRTGRPRADTTVFAHARYVKSFIRWCDAEGWADAGKLLKNVAMPGKSVKVVNTLSDDMVRRLFAAAQAHTPAHQAKRDVAIVSLLLDGGIRLSEATQLTIPDLTLTERDGFYLVHGKGRKDREIGLGRKARLALVRYLQSARGHFHPLPEERHVFVGRGGLPLGVCGIQKLLERLEREAGTQHFTSVRLSPHTLRHSFATRALRAGEDVARVSRRMGHSRLETTNQYLRSFTSHEARIGGVSPLDLL
jgi:integrase/recombinase XerD